MTTFSIVRCSIKLNLGIESAFFHSNPVAKELIKEFQGLKVVKYFNIGIRVYATKITLKIRLEMELRFVKYLERKWK